MGPDRQPTAECPEQIILKLRAEGKAGTLLRPVAVVFESSALRPFHVEPVVLTTDDQDHQGCIPQIDERNPVE